MQIGSTAALWYSASGMVKRVSLAISPVGAPWFHPHGRRSVHTRPCDAEQRAERAELKPADVQFAGEFRSRNEAADIRAPIGNAAQAAVDADGHLVLQRHPHGADVAGPQERRVPAHARRAVAMQRVRALVGAVELVRVPVHAIAHQARRQIRARRLHRATSRPRRWPARRGACPNSSSPAFRRACWNRSVANRALHLPNAGGIRHVQHHLEMLLVKLVEHRLGVGHDLFVEGELAVVGVPARGAKAGAEIDHRVAGQLLLAEGLGLLQESLPGLASVRCDCW